MHFPEPTATIHQLDNGLTLILDPHHAHPVISTQLWVETGSVHEDAWLGAGLSHFLEHMVFKGTKHYDSDRLAEIVQAAGGHWNAYTTFDRTVYYIDGPHSGCDTFLAVLCDMVFQPTLPESEFELEKDVIRHEIDMGLDDPSNASMRLILESAFRQDPRRIPVIGHRALFDRLSHSDLVSYHHERYTPNRAFFAISGDFEPAHVIAQIEKLTASFPMGLAREPYVAVDTKQCSLRQAEATFAVPTSRITLAWKTPPLGSPEAPIYDLLATMVGRGRSSHLYTTLRENRELALEVSAWSWTDNSGEGLFAISAECEPEQRHSLIAATREELANFAALDFTVPLARAKRQITASQYNSLCSASGRAGDLASNWNTARDLHFTKNYLIAIDQISADDVRRCLALLQDSQLTITQLNPLGVTSAADQATIGQQQKECHTLSLANGLKIALFPDARVPLVSIQACARCGLPAETMETAGVGALLSSMLTKGTKNRTALEISSTLEGLGASLHASTGNNSFLINGGCLSPDLPTLLELFADVVLHPIIPEDALKREKASQLSSIRESKLDPLETAFQRLRAVMFNETGYGIPAVGTEASMAHISREDLIAHHARHMRANNMTLAISGDFDQKKTILLLENLFKDLPTGDSPQPSASSLRAAITETLWLDKKQAVLALGYPGIPILDQRQHALAMLQEYCNDMAGPLFNRIREELGLAYQVGVTHFHGYDTGMIAFYVSTSPEQLELAHSELLLEIAKIARNGIPAEALENVRATVLSSLVLGQQSPKAIARSAAVDLLFGLPADHHRHLHEEIRKLQAEDIRQVAADLLSQVVPVTVIVTQQHDEEAALNSAKDSSPQETIPTAQSRI